VGGPRYRAADDSARTWWTSRPFGVRLSALEPVLLRARRPLVVVAAIALLVVVVALASRPGGPEAPVVGAAVTRTVLDSVLYLLIALGLIEGLVLVWLLWPHEDTGPAPRLERRRHSVLAALLLAITLVLLVWSRSRHLGSLPLLGAGLPSVSGPPGGPHLGAGSGGAPQGTDWAAIGVTVVALAAIVAVGWRALRTPGRVLRVLRSPRTELEAVLDDAMIDAATEADPRRAVLAAWARVERLLAEHDAGRRPHEAPFEYAARAAVAVGLNPGALERLAGLYEWARFSVHEVTSEMRRDALDGLTQVRERLLFAH